MSKILWNFKRYYSIFSVKDFNYPTYKPPKISLEHKEPYHHFLQYEKQYQHNLVEYCDEFLYQKIFQKLKNPEILEYTEKYNSEFFLNILRLPEKTSFSEQKDFDLLISNLSRRIYHGAEFSEKYNDYHLHVYNGPYHFFIKMIHRHT